MPDLSWEKHAPATAAEDHLVSAADTLLLVCGQGHSATLAEPSFHLGHG